MKIFYLIKEGFRNIWANRMMSLASVIVLVSCLIITGAASLISVNVTSLISKIGDDDQITVYLDYEMNDLDSIKLGQQLGRISNIDNYSFYSRDDAIQKYKEVLGNIYESMQDDGNPFGNAYKVTLKDLSKYKQTVDQIKKIKGVTSVSDRSDIANKLTKLNYFVFIVGSWVVLILAIVTLFIISNTIKMTMYSRRHEISIMKSVGATNSFIRVPFIIEAMVIGLLSGVIAAAVICAIYTPVREMTSGIIGFIGESTFTVEQVMIPTFVVMSAIGLLIGIVGGYISIARYLRKEGGDILDW